MEECNREKPSVFPIASLPNLHLCAAWLDFTLPGYTLRCRKTWPRGLLGSRL